MQATSTPGSTSAHLAAAPSVHEAGTLTPDEVRTERRELHRRRRIAFLLVVPLLAFIFFAFVAPIASMLYRSVYNPAVAELIPETVAALSDWKTGLPCAAALKALAGALSSVASERKSGALAAAINRIQPGSSSLINATARKMRQLSSEDLASSGAAKLREADARWAQPELWRAI